MITTAKENPSNFNYERDNLDSFAAEKRYQHKDGHVVWGLVSVLLVRDANGDPGHFVAQIQDITEQRHAEEALKESEARFRTLVQHAPEAITVYDFDRDHYVDVNEHTSRLLKYSREELLALSPADVSPPTQPNGRPSADMAREYIEATLQGKDPVFEWVHRDSDGRDIPVEIRLVQLPAAGRKLIRASLTDITARKEQERRLHEAHDELEQRVQERTAALSTANEKLVSEISERRRVERALRKSESHQSLILNSVPVALYMSRPKEDWNTTWASGQIEALSGFSAAECVDGTHLWARRIHPEDRDRVFDFFDKFLAGAPGGVEYRWKCKDGRYRWFMDRPAVMTTENGEITEVVGTWLDITERKEMDISLRESEARLHAVLENTTAVIYVKGLDGRYVLANRRYEDLFQVPRERIIGRTDHEIHAKETADAFRENDRQVLAKGGPIEFEETAVLDGEVRTYLSLKFPLLDDRGIPFAVCGISTDITERQRIAGELQRAKEAAEAANHAKTVFLANISHEIRTPITAMLGAAELLGVYQAADGTPDQVDMILRNGRHLVALIDDLLDLSRADAGKLDMRRVDCSLPDIIKDIEALLRPLHGRSAVDVRIIRETLLPERIVTDPTRLKQAAINLINNALKFTEFGRVYIRFAVNRDDDRPVLTVSVEDTGPGIAKKNLVQIFETFSQFRTSAPGVMRGVGLGLPLVKWIAAQLGGAVTVTSRYGQGSTFVLTVAIGPLHGVRWLDPGAVHLSVDTNRAQLSADREPEMFGRILLAEDFDDTRGLIETVLTACGAEVTAVCNGREAVDAAANEEFDLIIMDVRMPEMDGGAATSELRRRRCLTPIIALTASAVGTDDDPLFDTGFDDVWPKPLAMSELVERVRPYLHAASPRDRESFEDRKPLPKEERDARIAAAAAEFVAMLPARVRAIEAFLEGSQPDRAGEILHQLVGAAGLHGLDAISRESARLLVMIREGKETGDIRDLVRLVEEARGSAMPDAAARISETDAKDSGEGCAG